MQNKKRLGVALALAFALAATAPLALTAQAPDFKNEITARQSVMRLYVFNIGQLAAMAKGDLDYDSARAATAAGNLALMAKVNQSWMWPAGSDNFSVDNTRAMPELWDNLPDAQAKQRALIAATDALAAVAGDGLDAVRANLGAVGQACGACHKAYREPK